VLVWLDFLLVDSNPPASSVLTVRFRRGLCVQRTSGVDVALSRASISTASGLIHKPFP
jgi:hypothetical protein